MRNILKLWQEHRLNTLLNIKWIATSSLSLYYSLIKSVKKQQRYANFFVCHTGLDAMLQIEERKKKIKLTLMSLNNLCFLIFKMESSHKISFILSCVNFFLLRSFYVVVIILNFFLFTANFFLSTLFKQIIFFILLMYIFMWIIL